MRRIRLPFGLEVRSLSDNEQQVMKRWERLVLSALTGSKTASGRYVSPETAMNASALNAAVSLKSGIVASLPPVLYKRLDGGGRDRAREHWAYHRLTVEPNPEMTRFEFLETLYAWRLLWGEAYTETRQDAAGRDGHIWPLHPALIDKERTRAGVVRYIYTEPGTGERRELDASRIQHFRGLSLDGFSAGRPYAWMREALGLALATEEYSAKFFGQGGHIGGILEYDGELSPEAGAKLKRAMADRSGLDTAHLLMLLEYGIKYREVNANPADSQLIEARKFQVSEIARFVGLPAHLVGDLERATFSNIEHQDLELVKFYLRPDLVRFSQRLGLATLTEAERRTHYVEFLVDALLQGDVQKRGEFYRTLWSVGAISQDEIRERENLNPIPDGRGAGYFVPLNFIPLAMAEQGITGQREAPPAESRALTAAPRAATERHRLALAYRPVFDDSCRRIVHREVADVRRAADKFLKRGDRAGFVRWCEDYYRSEDFTAFHARQVSPVVSSVAEQVIPTAAAEVDATDELVADAHERAAEFTSQFAASAAERWAAASRRQLQALAEGRAEGDDDAYEQVGERLDGWETSRAESEGQRHATESVNALARFALGLFGAMKLVSFTTGASDCPYCDSMNGRVVGIQTPFLTDGDTINPGGGLTPMVIRGPKYHPPYHKGCDCQVQAAF